MVGIIDIFSRKIVGWRLSPFLDTKPCLDTFKEALLKAVPEMANSDQGCQFTSQAWASLLESCGIKISMDGVGRWADNIFIERFWCSIKWECIYLNSLETLEQAKLVIEEYILDYNTKRPHSSLGYRTPEFVYTDEQAQQDVVKLMQVKEEKAMLKKIKADALKNNDEVCKKVAQFELKVLGQS